MMTGQCETMRNGMHSAKKFIVLVKLHQLGLTINICILWICTYEYTILNSMNWPLFCRRKKALYTHTFIHSKRLLVGDNFK